MTDEEKRAFAHLSRSLRRAIRLQIALDGQRAEMLAGTFDALDAYAFICSGDGEIVGSSAKAEQLLREGRWLAKRKNRLFATQAASQSSLGAALSSAAKGEHDKDALVVRDAEGLPLYLEVMRFPTLQAIQIRATVLVIARPPRRRELLLASLAKALFKLTATEALIASYLSEGKSPQRIAELCGTSTGTVRTHLKRIYDKTGARSQVELVSLLTSHF